MSLKEISLSKKTIIIIASIVVFFIVLIGIITTVAILNGRKNISVTTNQAATVTKIDSKFGVTFIDSKYPKKDDELISYGASQAKSLGFQTVEIDSRDCNTSCGNTLKDRFNSPSFAPIINNFSTIFTTTYPLMKFAEYCDPVGLIDSPTYDTDCGGQVLSLVKQDYKAYAKEMLTKYKNTGKTFINIAGNEFDYEMSRTRPGDINIPPPRASLENTKKYWNTIQDAINEAKAEAGTQGVNFYNACEVSKVWKSYYYYRADAVGKTKTDDTSLDNLTEYDSITNKVLPDVHCDLYGYSAYDSMLRPISDVNYTDPAFGLRTEDQLYDTVFRSLKYMKDHVKNTNGPFGANNIFISEFGIGLNKNVQGNESTYNRVMCKQLENLFVKDIPNCGYTSIRDINNLRASVGASGINIPYFLYWQLYDNECTWNSSTAQFPNDSQCAGYWIVRPDGQTDSNYSKIIAPGFGTLVNGETTAPTQAQTSSPITTSSTPSVVTYSLKVDSKCSDPQFNFDNVITKPNAAKYDSATGTESLNKTQPWTFTDLQSNGKDFWIGNGRATTTGTGFTATLSTNALVDGVQVATTSTQRPTGTTKEFHIISNNTFTTTGTHTITFIYDCAASSATTAPVQTKVSTSTVTYDLTVDSKCSDSQFDFSTVASKPNAAKYDASTGSESLNKTQPWTFTGFLSSYDFWIGNGRDTTTGTGFNATLSDKALIDNNQITTVSKTRPSATNKEVHVAANATFTTTGTHKITFLYTCTPSTTQVTTSTVVTTTTSAITTTVSQTSAPTTITSVTADNITLTENDSTTIHSSKPLFKGKTDQNTSVDIKINADRYTTTSDNNGNWTYTPTIALIEGSNTVSIIANSIMNTYTVVYEKALPNTGLIEDLFLTIGISTVIIISAVLIRNKRRLHRVE